MSGCKCLKCPFKARTHALHRSFPWKRTRGTRSGPRAVRSAVRGWRGRAFTWEAGRAVAAACRSGGGGRARAREREVRDEESRGEARQAGRHAGAHAPWLWRWRSSDSSSSAKGGELYGSRGCSSRSCCGARSLPRLVAGSRGGDVGASRCRQGWRPSLRPRWHSTNGRHPTPSHQHHHVLVRLQSAPGAVAPSLPICVCVFSLALFWNHSQSVLVLGLRIGQAADLSVLSAAVDVS